MTVNFTACHDSNDRAKDSAGVDITWPKKYHQMRMSGDVSKWSSQCGIKSLPHNGSMMNITKGQKALTANSISPTLRAC